MGDAAPSPTGARETEALLLGDRYRWSGTVENALDSLQRAAAAEIVSRLDDGRWNVEDAACALCGGADFERVARSDKHGLPVSCVICRGCGLVQLSPRWSEDAYRTFYDRFYRDLYQGESQTATPDYMDDYFSLQSVQGRLVAATLDKAGVVLSEGATVLEVGCSAGGVLAEFAKRGHRCIGLDYDVRYLEAGRAHGLDLRQGGLDRDTVDEAADLIIYSHVLEHIPALGRELRTIREFLKPDGVLFIEVPGLFETGKAYDYDFKRSLQAAHVYYFTRRHLTALLERNGFRTVYADEHVRGVFAPLATGSTASPAEAPNAYREVRDFLVRTETHRAKHARALKAKAAAKRLARRLLASVGLELAVRSAYRWFKNRPAARG